jgi:branched-subunit amino acid ABC-type transport system permease component/ABC-type branched-subunit amino acid transport system ATPase component
MGTLVLGLITGLILGLLSMGLVFVYKAARFVNLAHTQLGVLGAVFLAKVVIDHGWPYWAGFALAIVTGVAVGVASERFVIRRLRSRSPVAMLLATLGLAQVLLALTYVKQLAPDQVRLQRRGYPIPLEGVHVSIGGFVIHGQHVLILVLAPLLSLALALFLRRTALGTSIRAMASNRDAAQLAGISVARVSAVTWGAAGALSAVTAVLLAPAQWSLNGFALGPSLLLRALGGAAVGGFVSLPLAMAGGVGLGLLEQLALHRWHDAGIAQLVVLLAVVVILLVRGRAIAEAASHEHRGGDEVSRSPVPARLASRSIVRHERAWLALIGTVIAVLLPLLPVFRSDAHRFQLTLLVVFAILGISLTLLMGWAGMVSLGHYAVLGAGAYMTWRLQPHGWSLPVIVVAAGLVGAVLMALAALPALRRTSAMVIAITTLGLAVVAPAWLYQQSWFGVVGNAPVDPPRLMVGLGTPRTLLATYYVVVVALALTMVAVGRLRRSAAGRLIVAVRDNDDGAASLGFSPATTRLAVAATSGFIAAGAGVLWVTAWHNVSPDLFSPDASVAIVAIPVIGGLGSLSGAVLGSVVVFAPSLMASGFFRHVFGNDVGISLLLSGVGLLVTQLRYPQGLAAAIRAGWDVVLRRIDEGLPEAAPEDRSAALVVEDVSVRFGGMVAVDHVSLTVEPGEIVGLIGPNGAGKSTLLDAVSGRVRTDGGRIRAFGVELTPLPPEMRAHVGVSRSHQDARLYPGLTVREAVQVALGRTRRSGYLATMVGAPWVRAAERAMEDEAAAVIERFGLTAWADTLAGELSTGTRRICDLALQVATGPRILLLDEPTAGVAQRDAEAFGPLIRRLRDELG